MFQLLQIFISLSNKARHQCPQNLTGLVLTTVNIQHSKQVQSLPEDFKQLLSTLKVDDISALIMKDPVIQMVGRRSYNALKRRTDKVAEGKRTVRGRMRLLGRLYVRHREMYESQSDVIADDLIGNAGDLFRRESVFILSEAVEQICIKVSDPNDVDHGDSVTTQKSGLKLSILNLLKLVSKYLVGYFLVQNEDKRSTRVADFMQVLKLFEPEMFGDALYDIEYKKNVKNRKPAVLPCEDDVRKVNDYCLKQMTFDSLEHPLSLDFVVVCRSTATFVMIFNGRRGGEPVRLRTYQWMEALNDEWLEKIEDDAVDVPEEYDDNSMLITYMTGKGNHHLVPVIFPKETVSAIMYLTNDEVRTNAGVSPNNKYVFPSTQGSDCHTSGWHCLDHCLDAVGLKGHFNATGNRHRVASLLGRLALSEKEKELVFKHFGHTRKMNENIYQTAAGNQQLKSTGSRLLQINEVC